MNKDELLALAVRVEALEGPDREVDAEIAIAVDGGEIVWLQANGTMDMYPARQYVSAMHVRGFGRAPIPTYTASIDAAMSLVPEGWHCGLGRDGNGHGPTRSWAWVRYPVPSPCAWKETGTVWVCGPPALALTAAALRAISQQEREG